jgi:signal transduction histidine kinase
MVDSLTAKVSAALADLRELARGIHPAILTDRGLGPAVHALAERCPVPVRVEIGIDERLTPPVESAAYFVVAEALTNVAKYAQARGVSVEIGSDGGEVSVRVEDDGRGGASTRRGTGLRGLHDRLAALDGSLEVDSPEGGGTRLHARIPVPEAAEARTNGSGTAG